MRLQLLLIVLRTYGTFEYTYAFLDASPITQNSAATNLATTARDALTNRKESLTTTQGNLNKYSTI